MSSPTRVASTTTTTTTPVQAPPEVVEEIDGSLLGTTSKITRPSPTNKKPIFNIVK